MTSIADTYTNYDDIMEAIMLNCRAEQEPFRAAQAMTRAVHWLLKTRSEAEVITLAADRGKWEATVRIHMRSGLLGGCDTSLSRQILPLLFKAAAELDAQFKACAAMEQQQPKGKHFTAKLAARARAAA